VAETENCDDLRGLGWVYIPTVEKNWVSIRETGPSLPTPSGGESEERDGPVRDWLAGDRTAI